MSIERAGLSEEQKKLFNKMTTKLQKAFCLALIKNEFNNQTDAYLKACRKTKRKPAKDSVASASELLTNPNVKAFVSSVRKKDDEKQEQDAEMVVGSFDHKRQMLIEVAQRCHQAVPVLDRQGNHVTVELENGEVAAAYCFEHKGVVSAIGELNKMDGDHAAQRVDLSASEDLVALLQAGRARVAGDSE